MVLRSDAAHPSFWSLAAVLRRGGIDRRTFLRQAAALGIGAGLAGALASAWSSEGHAASTTETAPPTGDFDYVVVGAGSAGAVCAARLATSSEARVLVLEAGCSDDLPEIHDPTRWLAAIGTRAAKVFTTVPQAHTAGRRHVWPRGNVLGGSSSVNAMIFARGHRSDFDAWAYAGCTGWSYADVLPIFRAMEDYSGGADAFRGTGGPLHVSRPTPDQRHEGAVAFVEAGRALGFPGNDDFNGAELDGIGFVDLSISDAGRQSSAVAFLKPAMARANLTVLTDAPVLDVVVEGGRCTGVRYLHAGVPRTVRAAIEVIVAAGALDTPRILMLSGIGPAADLVRLGIEVAADLPVGLGLQDHVLGAGVNYEARGPVPPSKTNSSEAYLWHRTDSRLLGPDVVTLHVSIPYATDAFALNHAHGYAILSGVSRPVSRGSLRLASSDPRDAPLIDPAYLTEEADRRAFRTATEIACEIGAAAAFDRFRAREVLPGDLRSHREWDDFLAKSASTFFHPTSTCRMGTGPEAVVDPELRVRGIEGLRVADASIMPQVVTTNTNPASLMIGWRAADLVLGIGSAERRPVVAGPSP
ncbi:GMC family oxidoreductase [Methylobrevis pamukkalensis]|uniref:Oxygen-dependent choline dehydrogenase n=1 Tax=Methylobrevis pamukkalensis TaxID=1439726 RepID=A0A1E3H5D0_9HYPH|nr:GMC family oxidoreductase N-terminal domain-containing protein [Methylobrevis pamukkalensis]ODN71522.1 Oxygen-dependent choline dehydrogenase [Methylobrevis pamukkalensis]